VVLKITKEPRINVPHLEHCHIGGRVWESAGHGTRGGVDVVSKVAKPDVIPRRMLSSRPFVSSPVDVVEVRYCHQSMRVVIDPLNHLRCLRSLVSGVAIHASELSCKHQTRVGHTVHILDLRVMPVVAANPAVQPQKGLTSVCCVNSMARNVSSFMVTSRVVGKCLVRRAVPQVMRIAVGATSTLTIAPCP
jgi:hypothetical protein